jgi:adenosine deaminase
MLAELHLHLYGCIRAADLLEHLCTRQAILWDWYEAGMEAAYGVVPPTREVVERYRSGDPSAARAFEEVFVFGDADAGNFSRFQAKYHLLLAGSSFSENESVPEEVCRELMGFAQRIRADHMRQGVSYAEQRLMLGSDLQDPNDRAVLDALLKAYGQTGGPVTERLAVSLHRDDPWAGWARVQELALGPNGEALTGIDFCFVEEGHPPKDKARFFSAVLDFNQANPTRALAILYHVGESFSDKSLESAVRWVQEAAELGAHRLGHAIALGVDPEVFGEHKRHETVDERRDQLAYDLAHYDDLVAAGVRVDPHAAQDELRALVGLPDDELVTIHYDRERLDQVRRRQDYAMRVVKATGAVVEVCPTSNRRIGGIAIPAHHPVHRFVACGLPVVVSSDDPGIFGTDLPTELSWVCEQMGDDGSLRQRLVETAWRSRSEVLSGRTP